MIGKRGIGSAVWADWAHPLPYSPRGGDQAQDRMGVVRSRHYPSNANTDARGRISSNDPHGSVGGTAGILSALEAALPLWGEGREV